MEVVVTEQDICLGKVNNTQECPVALACVRAGLEDFNVLTTMVICWKQELGMKSTDRVLNLPPEASDFIIRFDTGKPVLPFRFELDDSPRESL